VGRYNVGYSVGYPEKNCGGRSDVCGDCCSADRSADCSDNCSGSSSESNQPSNGTGSLLGYSESNPVGSLTPSRKCGSATAETARESRAVSGEV
jgi:hypothetical protein